MDSDIMKMYGQIKLHKVEKSVTTGYAAFISGLERFLTQHLQKINIASPHNIKNSKHLTDRYAQRHRYGRKMCDGII